MKKINSLLFFVALCVMSTTAYAQLSNGSQYRVFSEADPAHGVYGTDPFFWGSSEESGSFLTANNIAEWGADVWQFEYAANSFIRTAGGGKVLCATSSNPTGEPSNRWKLIADGELVGGVQYYLLQNQHNTARYMYFNPDDNKLYTNDAGVPEGETRKYYRVGFEKNEAPVLNVSTITLVFSSTFLSKDITVSGENIAADITFSVPMGITLSGTNVVNNAGSYSIAAANANGDNTVTVTANSDTGIDGTLSVSSTGATGKNITLKSGVKQGAWYNIKQFHQSENLHIGATAAAPAQPAVVVPNAEATNQLFTFIPVGGKDETFNLKNADGDYLLGRADGSTAYGAITEADEAEWTLDIRNGSTVIDYFTEFTLYVGSRTLPNYLALSAGTAADVPLAADKYRDDPRGTFILIPTSYIPTSIKEANEKTFVYANGNRQIVISGKSFASQLAVASVYNVTGQRIVTKTLETADSYIDVPEAGIYVVNISSNGVSKTHKIILK